MPDDDRDVYERLKAWDAKIRDLMNLYAGQSHIPRKDLERGRAMYKDLKDGLRTEYKSHQSSGRRPPLTEAERIWYTSPIHEAFCQLRAPTNSKSNAWFTCLFGAQIDITHMLSQMKSHYSLKD